MTFFFVSFGSGAKGSLTKEALFAIYIYVCVCVSNLVEWYHESDYDGLECSNETTLQKVVLFDYSLFLRFCWLCHFFWPLANRSFVSLLSFDFYDPPLSLKCSCKTTCSHHQYMDSSNSLIYGLADVAQDLHLNVTGYISYQMNKSISI